MKKAFILLFVFFFNKYSAGQISVIYAENLSDSVYNRTGIYGDFGFNSTSLSTNFVRKFYSGEYIDKDTKDGVLNKTRLKNRVGEDLNYGIFGSFSPDSIFHQKNYSFFINICDREHFDARYSDDLFKVGFYGNSLFAGETAYLSDFNLTFLRYQQFQFGFMKEERRKGIRWGMGFSYLKGEQYLSILAKKAELYTSEDGQFINFYTDMQVAQSDTAKRGIGAFNGHGASLDIYLESGLTGKLSNSKIGVSVSDIGVIRFNSESLFLNQDSLFRYSGFRITSINDLKDSTFGTTTKDSIINRIVPFEKRAFNVTLPATLNVWFETAINNRFHLTEGIKYVYNANYSLLFYCKSKFIINKNMSLTATVGYGGYGKLNCGLGIYGKFGKGFYIAVGSNNLEGYIAQNSSSGIGAYLSVIKNFR